MNVLRSDEAVSEASSRVGMLVWDITSTGGEEVSDRPSQSDAAEEDTEFDASSSSEGYSG